MRIEVLDNKITISGIDGFSARNTFTCGQCFRWFPNADGSYTGVAGGHAAKVKGESGPLTIQTSLFEFESFWKDYFDLERDYGELQKKFAIDEFTGDAMDFGSGMRILKQEPWEALCSFILSQCNNIPRIQSIVKILCSSFGEPFPFEGQTVYAFPSPEVIASLSEQELSPLRAGYRAPYILSAAREIADGKLDFAELENCSTEEGRRRLMQLPGVGAKVADCFLLFGLSKFDAFPVDTWIKKANAYCGGTLNPKRFGEYAGIAQQYIFHYMRSMKIKG